MLCEPRNLARLSGVVYGLALVLLLPATSVLAQDSGSSLRERLKEAASEDTSPDAMGATLREHLARFDDYSPIPDDPGMTRRVMKSSASTTEWVEHFETSFETATKRLARVREVQQVLTEGFRDEKFEDSAVLRAAGELSKDSEYLRHVYVSEFFSPQQDAVSRQILERMRLIDKRAPLGELTQADVEAATWSEKWVSGHINRLSEEHEKIDGFYEQLESVRVPDSCWLYLDTVPRDYPRRVREYRHEVSDSRIMRMRQESEVRAAETSGGPWGDRGGQVAEAKARHAGEVGQWKARRSLSNPAFSNFRRTAGPRGLWELEVSKADGFATEEKSCWSELHSSIRKAAEGRQRMGGRAKTLYEAAEEKTLKGGQVHDAIWGHLPWLLDLEAEFRALVAMNGQEMDGTFYQHLARRARDSGARDALRLVFCPGPRELLDESQFPADPDERQRNGRVYRTGPKKKGRN